MYSFSFSYYLVILDFPLPGKDTIPTTTDPISIFHRPIESGISNEEEEKEKENEEEEEEEKKESDNEESEEDDSNCLITPLHGFHRSLLRYIDCTLDLLPLRSQ